MIQLFLALLLACTNPALSHTDTNGTTVTTQDYNGGDGGHTPPPPPPPPGA